MLNVIMKDLTQYCSFKVILAIILSSPSEELTWREPKRCWGLVPG